MTSSLHAIVDADAAADAGWQPLDLARALLDGGATLLQLRAKSMPGGTFLQLCDAVVRASAPYHATVIVNDRVDLALMSRASGAHLGQDDLAPAEARRLLGPSAVIGFSTHTTDQLASAAREPVSYLAIGPVFGTRTKNTGYEAVGLTLVTAARRLAENRPVVAIGGITLETAPAVIAAGASAVAVIGDLLVGGDPRARVEAYRRVLGRA